jgi:[protein-PII] uridylyltransferase
LPSEAEELDRLKRRLEEFLETVPDRYLQVVRVDIIAKHFWMIQRIDEKERILWSLDPGLGVSELAVVSADVPGSFAKICGALSAKDINILSAQIFSTSTGYAINVFQITDLRNQPLSESFRIDRLRADLNQVFLERKSIEELMGKYKPTWATPRAAASSRSTEIRIDNESSQEFTIMEVRTGDRPGLLHQIASFLDDQKLNINRAMVSTEAYGVVDVFFVTDLEYNKIHDAGRIEKLRQELTSALDPPRAGSSRETQSTNQATALCGPVPDLPVRQSG